MAMTQPPLADIRFSATLIEWRGPAPFHFAPIPDRFAGEIRHAARLASYGWGCVPVTATIGETRFTTSLIPRDGTYLLPIRAAVRAAAGLAPGGRAGLRVQVLDRA